MVSKGPVAVAAASRVVLTVLTNFIHISAYRCLHLHALSPDLNNQIDVRLENNMLIKEGPLYLKKSY